MASTLPELPIELWNIILLLVCHTSSRNLQVRSGFGRAQAYVAPVALSQVCRRWRYLVINSPAFWTEISYSFIHISCSPRPRPELMQLFLDRSLGMPLTLDLQISDIGSPDSYRSAAYDFFLDLLANRNQWKSAKLYILLDAIDGDTWEELLDDAINDAHLLETLEVTVEPGKWGLDDVPLSAIFWNAAPKLTKLAIEFEGTEYTEEREVLGQLDEFISNWALTNDIPYHQLTHLLLNAGPNGEVTWKEIASIFALASNLISCSLRGISEYLNLPASTPRVILQHLQHLDLAGPQPEGGFDDPALLSSMNQILTAPSLQTLSLLQFEDRWDQNAYGDFIVRSNPPLTALHFGLSSRQSPRTLLECLRLSPPTLRSLHTNHTGVILPEFSEQLAEWDENARQFKLCPILEQLVFDIWIPPDFPTPFKGIVDMLRKRLCPPDGSSGSFKKVIVSSDIRRDAEEALIFLLREPYHLQIERARVCPEARAAFEMGSSAYM